MATDEPNTYAHLLGDQLLKLGAGLDYNPDLPGLMFTFRTPGEDGHQYLVRVERKYTEAATVPQWRRRCARPRGAR